MGFLLNPFGLILLTFVIIFYSCIDPVRGQSMTVTVPASTCTDEIRRYNCSLPTCRCSGTDIPGIGQTKGNTPQFVFLTFDDAVTFANYPLYEELFIRSNRRNPDGNLITATFFVNHEYTNYSMVHELWRHGHEIALHSVTHKSLTTYWKNLNEDMWHAEIIQQRDQVSTFAHIPVNDIKGMRAPFLQTGGDRMFKVLKQGGLMWESSRTTVDFRKPGLWPYTNDYASIQECQVEPCPIGRYPGFWSVPMLSLLSNKHRHECSMADMCYPETAKGTFNLLHRNFRDNYEGNKAPFGIYIHSAWIYGPQSDEIDERRKGYTQFLNYLGELDDVYIVSISRALEWIKNPTPLEKLAEFTPFRVDFKKSLCQVSKSCRFGPEETPFPTEAERYMHSCEASCPTIYPWLGDPLGRGKL